MTVKTLTAHFDGKRIKLDEPHHLEKGAKLLVVVLPQEQLETERESWSNLSQRYLEHAYGENEPEYSLNMVKEANPEYEGR